MKFEINLIALLLISSLVACAGAAQPFLYQGNYYMAGDSSCAKVRARTANTIHCLDKNGTDTGYRVAMSRATLQSYYQQKAQSEANRERFLHAMDGIANTLTEHGSKMRNNASTIPNVAFPDPSARTGQIDWPSNSTANMNKWVPSIGAVPTAPTTVIYGNCLGTISNGQCIGVFEQTSSGIFICNGPFVSGSCIGQLTLSKP